MTSQEGGTIQQCSQHCCIVPLSVCCASSEAHIAAETIRTGKFKGSARQEEKAKLLQKQDANNRIVDDFIEHNIDGFEKKFILFIACGDSSSARDRYTHFQFLAAVNAKAAVKESRRALKYGEDAFGFFLSDSLQTGIPTIMKNVGFHYLLNRMAYYYKKKHIGMDSSFGSNTSRSGSKRFPQICFEGGNPVILQESDSNNCMFSSFAMLVDFYVLQWRNTYKLEKRVCVANKNQTQILVSVEKYKPGLLYFFRTKEASALDPDQFNAALLETIRGMFVLLPTELQSNFLRN